MIVCLVVSRCSVFPVGGTDRSAISKERFPIHIRSTGTAPSAAEHPARSRNASAASYLEPCVRPFPATRNRSPEPSFTSSFSGSPIA